MYLSIIACSFKNFYFKKLDFILTDSSANCRNRFFERKYDRTMADLGNGRLCSRIDIYRYLNIKFRLFSSVTLVFGAKSRTRTLLCYNKIKYRQVLFPDLNELIKLINHIPELTSYKYNIILIWYPY